MTDVYISIDLYVHDCNDTAILPRFTRTSTEGRLESRMLPGMIPVTYIHPV